MKGDPTQLPFSNDGQNDPFADFIDAFTTRHSTPMQDADLERSWYIEEKEVEGAGSSKGYIHYGTFGFESNLVDNKTKATQYKRKVDDVEEIPLFYEIWCPTEVNYAFILFQSFQGRSCKSLVTGVMKSEFETENDGYIIKFKKLLPSDMAGSMFSGSAVRKVSLVRKNMASDLAEKYLGQPSPDPVDFEISITARPRKSLGNFGGLLTSVKNPNGLIIHDGITFSEAVAEIRVGSKIRRVGIFGDNGDAGVIDLTEEVDRGENGHPTFESLTRESNDILVDFHRTLSGQQR